MLCRFILRRVATLSALPEVKHHYKSLERNESTCGFRVRSEREMRGLVVFACHIRRPRRCGMVICFCFCDVGVGVPCLLCRQKLDPGGGQSADRSSLDFTVSYS